MVARTPHQRRLQRALTAAQLYYLHDFTMEAIGQELNISRSSVSRLLAEAKREGIVDVTITAPGDDPGRIEAQLLERFGIAASLVPVPERISHIDRLERVAVFAARLLPRFFSSNQVMGVAWGSTISAVSRHLVPHATTNSTVVQLNGAGNDHTTGITYSSEILRRFGQAWGANIEHFPVPAFFDNPDTKALLWQERSTKRVVDLHTAMDVVLFGVGALTADVPSHVYAGGYLTSDDIAQLETQHIVGDVATVFYRADGSWEDIPLNTRSSGPPLDVVRKTPRRLCVVAGASRLAALRGALAADLITDLIIDEGTARLLLAD